MLIFSLTRVSLTDNVTSSCFGHISVVCVSIWTFFFTILEFDKEAISDGFSSENALYRWRVLNKVI